MAALKSRDARYISQRAANAIISEVGPYRISTDALQSINTFLDEFLLQLVNTALSLDLSRIKTAVNQLLPSNLGKNAIVEAELEVKTFTESGEKIDYAVYERMRRLGTGQDAFPADRVLPQFREKCMFYCTLADKEPPGVIRPAPGDQDRDVIISPIVAIYVTAVVEHIAEYLLTLIAKAAEHEDTEFVRVKEVFTALIDDSQVGKVFYKMELKEKLEKRLFAYGYNTRPMTPTHDPIRNIASPPPNKREPSKLNNEGGPRDYHFEMDFDELDNDPRGGAISPPPQSNGGVQRTNTVTSNSSGKGNKDRSSMRLTNPQTYRPTSVLSTNTGSTATQISPSGSPNGKGGKGSSFKIFGGNKKKSGYEYGLESPTDNGGIDYDNDGYVEDDMEKSLDFEKLIQSGQTMKVTLTPNRLRTIEVKDQPGGKRTTPASSSWSQRAPPMPTKSTSSSSLPPPLPEKRVNFATSSRDEDDDEDDDDDDEFPMGGRRKGGKEESIFDFLRNTGPGDYGGKPGMGATSPTRNGSGSPTPRHVPIVIPQSNINDTNSKLNKLGMGSPTRGTGANMNSVDRPLPPPSSPRSPKSPSQQSPVSENPPGYLRPALKRNGSSTNESVNSTNSNSSSGRSDSPLRPRPPASAPARAEDEDDNDNDDINDLLSDGMGGQHHNKRVSYMSETSTLIDFLSTTQPPASASAPRAPTAATNSPPFNTRPRADSLNGGKKFVKIEIPIVESIEKMLKGQDSPKLPTEYKLPPGYQPVPGAGITGMKVPDEQVETVEKEVAQKEEVVPEIKVEEPVTLPPPPRSKSPVGPPRTNSLAERKVKFEQEAAAGEIDDIKSLRRKMPPTPSHDEKQQQSTEPERPSARTRFDPTVNGTVSATTNTAVITTEPETLPESEQNPEPLPETKRERPPSMVAKRASLFNTLATQENITISAKEVRSLRKQLTSANSVEMSVRVWDDFLHKNGGAVMHRRTTLRRANLTESEEEREQQLLQEIAANDAGANSDDGSASGSGRDSAGSERSNTRDSVVMTRARRFENPEEQQNAFEKTERTRAAEAIAAAREKREARRSLIMLANQHPPRPIMVEVAIQTDVVEPEPVVVTVAKVETAPSTEASADSPVTVAAEEKPKSQNPVLMLSAENEDGSVVEQEVELSDVETEEEEKGVVIGDEEWFLDADEDWEDNEADEALVAEWLLGEAVLAF